jgi:hypothetical protein
MAGQVVLEYYRSGRLEETLAEAILSASDVPPDESRSDRSKRTALLCAAKHLKTFGPTLHFDALRLRQVRTVISRVPVKVSLDFLAPLKTENSTLRLGIIIKRRDGGFDQLPQAQGLQSGRIGDCACCRTRTPISMPSGTSTS